jgi:hypothetical protein
MQKMLNANPEPGLIDKFYAQFEQEDFLVSSLEDPMNFSFSFEVPIDEKQVLHISATVKNGIIKVNSWIILSTGSWSVDNRLNVWTGE